MPRPRDLLVLITLAVSPQLAYAQTVACTLTVEPYSSSGLCVVRAVDTAQARGGASLLARLWPKDTVRIVITSRRVDVPPWRGVLLMPRGPIAFEIDRDRSGTSSERFVLRTYVSWVSVLEWREIVPTSGATVGSASLIIDLTAGGRAGTDDVVILQNALARVGEVVWDRKDDRNCANDLPGHASLFCVLVAAVEARMGRYHHRQPALELVRQVVNDRWRDRWQRHQLMDFNNHPSTTLVDMRTALEVALDLAKRDLSSPY